MNQVEQIARTFGVDWPHLIAQTVSFSIVCALLYWLAYRPVLTMLAARREQIATGLANAAKIKAELDRTEAQRQEVLAQGARRRRRGSSRTRRPRRHGSNAGNPESARRRRANHRQGARGRDAGSRADARRPQARGRPAGLADDGERDRQDPDGRRSTSAGGRDRRSNCALEGAMQSKRQMHANGQAALPTVCCRRRPRRGARAAGRSRGRSRRSDAASPSSSHASNAWCGSTGSDTRRVVESATPLPDPVRADIVASVARAHGAGHRDVVCREPVAHRRLRVQVGSDVYDGSVRARLDAIESGL